MLGCGMNKMKYIIYDTGLYESVMIFDHITQHVDVAQRIHSIESVVSAGFISVVDGKFQCFGRSLSLDIDSRPEDSDYVNKMMGITND